MDHEMRPARSQHRYTRQEYANENCLPRRLRPSGAVVKAVLRRVAMQPRICGSRAEGAAELKYQLTDSARSRSVVPGRRARERDHSCRNALRTNAAYVNPGLCARAQGQAQRVAAGAAPVAGPASQARRNLMRGRKVAADETERRIRSGALAQRAGSALARPSPLVSRTPATATLKSRPRIAR